jgi:hypothetical protein
MQTKFKKKKIKEAMGDVCREAGMTGYKVVSPVELLGIRPGMNPDRNPWR